ncbi:alpha/beta fold hydrolase [Agromyces salentinus]|uniref:Alpha/beta hydrolase n=1 Tax=Agromyces salentinus TaxID=269421 RepID=A0ABP4YU55_9MICO|nr:alpha/beta fold hydrolase [Agromyces salentinus]
MPHLELPGAELHYETTGRASAPVLLLIPAGIATLHMWDEHVPALAESHLVVRYDPRGFGATRHDAAVPFANHADALALLDHLGLASATVIGASRGGGIAIDTALTAPDRVDGLVAVSARVGGHPDVEPTPAEQHRFDAVEAIDPLVDPVRYIAEETALFAVGTGRDASEVDPAFLRRAHELAAPNVSHAADDGEILPLEPAAHDRLAGLDRPALVLVGEHDLSPFLAQYETLVTALPDAAGVRISDAAHLPSVERPEEFRGILLEWLAEHDL